MHGYIYQISDKPIEADDFIKEIDFENVSNNFDYCKNIDKEVEEKAINITLKRILPKTMFKCDGRKIIFLGGDENLFIEWREKVINMIVTKTPHEMATEDSGNSFVFRLTDLIEDILDTMTLFVDKENTGFFTEKSTEFVFDCIGRFKPGDVFYIGGVLDYHW